MNITLVLLGIHLLALEPMGPKPPSKMQPIMPRILGKSRLERDRFNRVTKELRWLDPEAVITGMLQEEEWLTSRDERIF